MLYRVRSVNQMPTDVSSSLVKFQVDGSVLGKVTPTMVDRLVQTPVFEIDGQGMLTLSREAGDTCESRTEAVQTVMKDLRSENVIKGWRDELYPITTNFYEDPAFLMERAAVPILGGVEYGVHINGLVKKADGKELMWMARRSKTKSKYPGMLDHMAAGGQPAGYGVLENVAKECFEEAGIPEELTLAGIKPAGAISYETFEAPKDCVSRAVLFCFDLWLPEDFKPRPVDGEVEEFFLWDIEQIKESMDREFDDPIKPNCYPVIIDFLLRFGHISPDTPGYLDILRELRGGECR